MYNQRKGGEDIVKSKKLPVRIEVIEVDNKIELYMYGTIEDDDDYNYYDENAITPNKVRELVNGIGGKDIDLHLSSPGGSVYGSVAIHNYLKQIPNKVTIFIDSIAFSGASIIAMAGDEVVMFPNSMIMVHQASLGFYGNADEFLETAKILQKFDEVVFNSYLKRYNGTNEDLKALIKAESYLSSQDCLSNGLCDRIEGEEDFETIETVENKSEKVMKLEQELEELLEDKEDLKAIEDAEKTEQETFTFDEVLEQLGIDKEDLKDVPDVEEKDVEEKVETEPNKIEAKNLFDKFKKATKQENLLDKFKK